METRPILWDRYGLYSLPPCIEQSRSILNFVESSLDICSQRRQTGCTVTTITATPAERESLQERPRMSQ